ncbi:hypothetical protein N7539_007820 [Penicillium diatomitis]|uniref:Uncharacterized protein n=1 Tax=Penicillium diatomitis TaxID=2819901 RepID=A0A9W9WU51_9EURO|nr:uncharacterized protein N7539_007820 [Penicillium diatomitis]KAJ5475533.1 hypothetical protein N7539_007820 [Penicillium diatomitis]
MKSTVAAGVSVLDGSAILQGARLKRKKKPKPAEGDGLTEIQEEKKVQSEEAGDLKDDHPGFVPRLCAFEDLMVDDASHAMADDQRHF